jgi:hypothetical protein
VADPTAVAESLRARIAALLVQIEEMFSDPVRVTCIVRNCKVTDGTRDLVLTSELDIELAISAARELLALPDTVRMGQEE